MTPPLAPQPTLPSSAPDAWPVLSSVTADAASLAARVDELVSELAAAVAALQADRSLGPALPTLRCGAAADLAAAGARLHHGAARLQTLAAGVVEREGVHLMDAQRSSRTWLARHAGIGQRAAGGLVRGAATLELYPLVAASFAAGDLTTDHLDAISRIIPTRLRGQALRDAIERVTDIQQLLLDTAAATTVDEFAAFCARIRQLIDADGPGDRSAEPSRVWLTKLYNGRWALTGDLSADDGALLATILADLAARERAAAAEQEHAQDPAQDPTEDASAEPDLVENPAGSSRGSERTARHFVQLARDGAGATRPGRIGAYVHIDLSDHGLGEAAAALARAHGLAHTDAGYDITDDSLWALLAGADVTPVIHLGGTPLSYGRTRRLAPPDLRRILAHRDRRCRFPGCDRPTVECESHHLRFWEHLGTTDPANLAAACTFHHRKAVHGMGFTLTGDPNRPDGLRARRPDGTPLDLEPRYRTAVRQDRPTTCPSRGRG